MFDVIEEIVISKKEFTETNYKRLKKALVYIENNLIDSDGGIYLTVDSLIEINNMITGSNNITLRKVDVKPYGFDKMYGELISSLGIRTHLNEIPLLGPLLFQRY